MTTTPRPPRPSLTLSCTVLDAPDAAELADFYRRLLGWGTVQEEPGWVRLAPPGGGSGLGFQTEEAYVPPVWPAPSASPGDQLMMLHLDFEVTDMEAGVAHAVAEGATPAEFQPQDDVRVLLDPVGHPFCLVMSGKVPGHPPAVSPGWVAEQTRDLRARDRVTAAEAMEPDRREAAGTAEPEGAP
ncbi:MULTISPECIES: VOC family protein [Streptomyces]|uniref:VOC family protein n=1 Tax=Streptomyces TaxID=1883 RepID=UPI0004CAB627|nr:MULTISPECIES: VOC family protein [Streptomyces]RPK93490.1 Glyoxalase-like domain protein [Streptomyces sp. ADI98-10]